MSNLREMLDGTGSLELDVPPVDNTHQFRLHDEVVIRRPMENSHGRMSEIIVGELLAFGDNKTATVSVKRMGGIAQRLQVNVKDLSPVTERFRRQSMQFSPAGGYRGRV